MTDNQITTEGNTVGEALRKAAEQLGIPVEQVDHKLDLSHFRNESGRPVAVDSVKIICWAADPSEKEGAFAAKAWLEGLISAMGLQGTVTARNIKDKKATIAVDSESARFLVGRGGSTLQAIQLMLNTAPEPTLFKLPVLTATSVTCSILSSGTKACSKCCSGAGGGNIF